MFNFEWMDREGGTHLNMAYGKPDFCQLSGSLLSKGTL